MKRGTGVTLVAAPAVAAAVLAAALSGRATPTAAASAPPGPSCSPATIAITGPFTGPAAAAGLDQRNWARLLIDYWNTGKPIPGTPADLRRTMIDTVQADTQLKPRVAAAVATRLRDNAAVLAVAGFSGSQENAVGGPILRRGGLVFVSGSAARASLTDPASADGQGLRTGYFYRVVPNDDSQGDVDADFVLEKMGVEAGDRVLTIDQAEAYSIPLIRKIAKLLAAAGVIVDHQSQEATQADFSALADRAVAEQAKAVVLGSQVPENAQLLLSQLYEAGYTGSFLGTDGVFDSKRFTVPGAFVSSFRLDVHKIPADTTIVGDFERRFGDTRSFGPPTWVAVQVLATAVSKACADGRATRNEVRRIVPTVSLPTTLLGGPIAFKKNGDLKDGSTFSVFQIQSNGSYKVVQPG